MKHGDPDRTEALELGPPPASLTRVVTPDRVPLLSAYAERLATDGVVRGLIGPREVPRLWDRHLVNCALMAEALPPGATVADVGSGAGLPGLVLAIVRPDVRMTLIEPLLRRTTFLSEVVEELGLDNVVVRRDRADAVHGEQVFDAVTARAVAPLDRLAGWCMPLVSPHGSMVAMKGSAAAEEIVVARPVLSRLGCGDPVIEVYGEDVAREDPTVQPVRVVRVSWADPSRVSLRASGGRGAARGQARRRGGPRTRKGRQG